MTSQAEALYHLQQIDLQIIRHTKRLGEISLALQNNDAVLEAQRQTDAAQEKLKPIRKKARDLELEIQSNTQKSSSTEDRLYSGSVKNPKELQDMQQEIEALKRRSTELEDQLLEQMVAIEAAEAELKEAQANLETVTLEWEHQHRDLLTEQDALKTQIAQLHTAREAALKLVAAENLQLYDSMRAKKANQPISSLRGNNCAVCGIEQTITVAQDVRRGEKLITCVNCGRILADVRVTS